MAAASRSDHRCFHLCARSTWAARGAVVPAQTKAAELPAAVSHDGYCGYRGISFIEAQCNVQLRQHGCGLQHCLQLTEAQQPCGALKLSSARTGHEPGTSGELPWTSSSRLAAHRAEQVQLGFPQAGQSRGDGCRRSGE